MMPFQLKYLVSLLYQLLLLFIKPVSFIKKILSSLAETLKYQCGRKISIPSGITIWPLTPQSSPVSSPSSSTSTLSSPSTLSNQSSTSLSSWASSSSEYIGNNSFLSSSRTPKSAADWKRKNHGEKKTKKEFPPSPLVRGGRTWTQYPWATEREYVEGRLVLRTKGVDVLEPFHVERQPGRLVLSLPSSCYNPDSRTVSHNHVTQEDAAKMKKGV